MLLNVTTPINFGIIIHKGLDGQRIITYGGIKGPSQESLYVLDIINFEWYIPKVSGKIPSSRYLHQANVIGKYMVISFGNNIQYIFLSLNILN